MISDPKKWHYISIPITDMECIKARWYNHPILKYSAKGLVMQSLRNIEGIKDAGYKWYQLLYKIFDASGVIVDTIYKGVFSQDINGHKAAATLPTDDILFATTHEIFFEICIEEFDKYFSTAVLRESQLVFSDYRLVQSKYDTIIY